MFGLDQEIASLASTKPLVALAVALLLGLRHPLDPDHLAAVAAMAKDPRRRSALVGLAWGAGHASTVLVLGAPVVLWAATMPEGLHQAVEALIGIVIFVLGVRLLIRHGRGELHDHPHETPGSLRDAYAVGVLHGTGGSAAVGVLILAAIPDHGIALGGLLVFCLSSAVAMAAVAAGLGRSLRSVPAGPSAGVICVFGVWYLASAAVGAPYPF